MTIGRVRYVLSYSGGWCFGWAWFRHDVGQDWAWIVVAGVLLLGWWLACGVWEART